MPETAYSSTGPGVHLDHGVQRRDPNFGAVPHLESDLGHPLFGLNQQAVQSVTALGSIKGVGGTDKCIAAADAQVLQSLAGALQSQICR
jgi:hypothetical protein